MTCRSVADAGVVWVRPALLGRSDVRGLQVGEQQGRGLVHPVLADLVVVEHDGLRGQREQRSRGEVGCQSGIRVGDLPGGSCQTRDGAYCSSPSHPSARLRAVTERGGALAPLSQRGP